MTRVNSFYCYLLTSRNTCNSSLCTCPPESRRAVHAYDTQITSFKLESIVDIFIEAGKGETAAVIIQNGTRPDAKMVTGKVKDIARRAQHSGLGNPAVILIGEVVNLNRELAGTIAAGNGMTAAMSRLV